MILLRPPDFGELSRAEADYEGLIRFHCVSTRQEREMGEIGSWNLYLTWVG
jgi:hypothetical protein